MNSSSDADKDDNDNRPKTDTMLESLHSPKSARVPAFFIALGCALCLIVAFALAILILLACMADDIEGVTHSGTLLLSAAGFVFLAIGVFGTTYQVREDLAQHHDETRFNSAELFVSITEKMLGDESCQKAILMLDCKKSLRLNFAAEPSEKVKEYNAKLKQGGMKLKQGGIRAVATARYSSYELLLALDSHSDSRTYWKEKTNGTLGSTYFAYHADMRQSFLKFCTWLSYVDLVCIPTRIDVPAPLKRFTDLLNPFRRYADPIDVIVSLFAWRRVVFSAPHEYKALWKWVFIDIAKTDNAKSLQSLHGWITVISKATTKEDPLLSMRNLELREALQTASVSEGISFVDTTQQSTYDALNAMIGYVRNHPVCQW